MKLVDDGRQLLAFSPNRVTLGIPPVIARGAGMISRATCLVCVLSVGGPCDPEATFHRPDRRHDRRYRLGSAAQLQVPTESLPAPSLDVALRSGPGD